MAAAMIFNMVALSEYVNDTRMAAVMTPLSVRKYHLSKGLNDQVEVQSCLVICCHGVVSFCQIDPAAIVGSNCPFWVFGSAIVMTALPR
jgi:hypothetical protein